MFHELYHELYKSPQKKHKVVY